MHQCIDPSKRDPSNIMSFGTAAYIDPSKQDPSNIMKIESHLKQRLANKKINNFFRIISFSKTNYGINSEKIQYWAIGLYQN